jgi:uncharacterized membrane protein
MSHHHEAQPEFAYGRSRAQRRLLVLGMWVGPILAMLGSKVPAGQIGPIFTFANIAEFVLVLGGLLLSFTCWYLLYHLMKDISEKPLNKLDERQALVSGRAYRMAFHIVVIGAALFYVFQAHAWLSEIDLSWIGIWLLTMLQSLPRSIMAWTEPD